jgi:guanine deaminase
MNDPINFLQEAISLWVENVTSVKGNPFGAVIVKDGQIIAKGVNQVTSYNDPTAHAEVVAIREACNVLNSLQLNGCVVYASCEPCPMCLGAIYWTRPDALYYAATKEDAAEILFDDQFIYEEIDLRPDQRKLPTFQILRDEALEAFQLWAVSTKKIVH